MTSELINVYRNHSNAIFELLWKHLSQRASPLYSDSQQKISLSKLAHIANSEPHLLNDTNEYGQTPLGMAVFNIMPKAVTILLDAGADPNTTLYIDSKEKRFFDAYGIDTEHESRDNYLSFLDLEMALQPLGYQQRWVKIKANLITSLINNGPIIDDGIKNILLKKLVGANDNSQLSRLVLAMRFEHHDFVNQAFNKGPLTNDLAAVDRLFRSMIKNPGKKFGYNIEIIPNHTPGHPVLCPEWKEIEEIIPNHFHDTLLTYLFRFRLLQAIVKLKKMVNQFIDDGSFQQVVAETIFKVACNQGNPKYVIILLPVLKKYYQQPYSGGTFQDILWRFIQGSIKGENKEVFLALINSGELLHYNKTYLKWRDSYFDGRRDMPKNPVEEALRSAVIRRGESEFFIKKILQNSFSAAIRTYFIADNIRYSSGLAKNLLLTEVLSRLTYQECDYYHQLYQIYNESSLEIKVLFELNQAVYKKVKGIELAYHVVKCVMLSSHDQTARGMALTYLQNSEFIGHIPAAKVLYIIEVALDFEMFTIVDCLLDAECWRSIRKADDSLDWYTIFQKAIDRQHEKLVHNVLHDKKPKKLLDLGRQLYIACEKGNNKMVRSIMESSESKKICKDAIDEAKEVAIKRGYPDLVRIIDEGQSSTALICSFFGASSTKENCELIDGLVTFSGSVAVGAYLLGRFFR